MELELPPGLAGQDVRPRLIGKIDHGVIGQAEARPTCDDDRDGLATTECDDLVGSDTAYGKRAVRDDVTEGRNVMIRSDKPRHPEKAKRPDTPLQSKPAWIRVKAPGSAEWAETKRIVRENKLVTDATGYFRQAFPTLFFSQRAVNEM